MLSCHLVPRHLCPKEVCDPQIWLRVDALRSEQAVAPDLISRPASTFFVDAAGAASQASPAEQQQGSLVQKHVQSQTPVRRPVYKHVGRGKLQLLVSKDKAAAINRSQQQNAWVGVRGEQD